MPQILLLSTCLALLVLVATAKVLPEPTLAELYARSHGARIFGGENATEGQFPWQVAIYYENDDTSHHFCSGALISFNYVLTAASCLDRSDKWEVHLSLTDRVVGGIVDYLSTKQNYPLYTPSTSDANPPTHDLTLIRLTVTLEESDDVRPISVNPYALATGTPVTVSGWGSHELGEDLDRYLTYVVLTTIPDAQCQAIYFGLDPGGVCAQGVGGRNICEGDIGDPMIVGSGLGAELVGVASFIHPGRCDVTAPSVFTRIDAYYPWIRDNSDILTVYNK